MLVKIRSGQAGFTLPLPTALVLNPLTARGLSALLKQKGVDLTAAQAARLVKALNRYRKTHPEWCLVDAITASGEQILVKL